MPVVQFCRGGLGGIGRAWLLGAAVCDAPIVAYGQVCAALAAAQGEPDMVRMRMLADIGERFLHQTVNNQLGGRLQRHRGQITMHGGARLLGELARQNFKRRDKAKVGQRLRVKAFDDAVFERNAMVQRGHQMDMSHLSLCITCTKWGAGLRIHKEE